MTTFFFDSRNKKNKNSKDKDLKDTAFLDMCEKFGVKTKRQQKLFKNWLLYHTTLNSAVFLDTEEIEKTLEEFKKEMKKREETKEDE